jgi:hypothetical protein
MKLRTLIMTTLLNIALYFFIPNVQAAQIQSISEQLKEALINAKPILGRKVHSQTFTNKPLLINFFASW